MASALWFLLHGDREVGPVFVRVLRRLAASGELDPTSLVRREGEREWIPAANVDGLFTEGTSGDSLSAPAEAPWPSVESADSVTEGRSAQPSLSAAVGRAHWPTALVGRIAAGVLIWLGPRRKSVFVLIVGSIVGMLSLALLAACLAWL